MQLGDLFARFAAASAVSVLVIDWTTTGVAAADRDTGRDLDGVDDVVLRRSAGLIGRSMVAKGRYGSQNAPRRFRIS